MEAPALHVAEPTTEPPAEPAPKEPPRPLRELLPAGLARAGVAVTGAALLAASFADFGASGRALVGAVLCPVLVLLAAIDLKYHLLPNAIALPAALLVLLIVAAADAAGFFEHLEAGLALGGFLFVFAVVFPSGLGMGDAKVGLLLGLALGSRTLSAMMVAFAGLFLAALWVLARRGLSARKQAIPFGPFLALGGILAFFFG
jgi:leader peptidase (prepilin peptidase) / N-methyltransferase